MSDILIRICERIPYAFVILWAINHGGLSAQQFSYLVAFEMFTAMVCYIPVAHLADKYGRDPFVLVTFGFFTLFPIILLWATNFGWLAFAFVVRGLKEFGEPARKALIIGEARPELRARTYGAYYLIRDCMVASGSFLGAWLWSISPQANFIGAAICGALGTGWFWWTRSRQYERVGCGKWNPALHRAHLFPCQPLQVTYPFSHMTTANKITILRMLLVPFFVVEVLYYVKTGNEAHRVAALLTFAVAAICDGVDGYIARRYHQWSELGTILDPLADKLLLVSGVVLLSFDHGTMLGQIPYWLTGTIIGRDLLVFIGLVVIRLTVGKVKIRPHFVGKVATVLQMITVLWLLLKWDTGAGTHWAFGCTLGAAICTGVSALLYVREGMRQLSASPSSLPSHPPR